MDLAGTVIECYDAPVTAMAPGAMDHIAFEVKDVEAMYRACKEKGYRLMEECRDEPGASNYWPKALRWFIVYGPNEEKIEFCKG